MNKCCIELLQDIKKYIKEQAKMYKETRRYSVGFALNLLVDDIVFKYETEIKEATKILNEALDKL
jgi:hypothetical protein